MSGVEFEISSDSGSVVAEWFPASRGKDFPRGWDWWLASNGIELASLDTYSGTATLGDLETGLYRLRIRAKGVVAPAWSSDHETTFRVVAGGRVVSETEIRLGLVLDRVGELVGERDELQRLLEKALQDLDLARATVEVLTLQLESLRALGSQPHRSGPGRVWRALASPAVAAIVAITAIPVTVYASLEGAQIQAEATLGAAEGDKSEDLNASLEACLRQSETLLEMVRAKEGS